MCDIGVIVLNMTEGHVNLCILAFFSYKDTHSKQTKYKDNMINKYDI